jgi:hypothetical protein
MLSVIMLSVIMLSVIMLNVIILSVIMLNVNILSVIMLNAVMLSILATTRGHHRQIINRLVMVWRVQILVDYFSLALPTHLFNLLNGWVWVANSANVCGG